jgi:hypothetical protein
MAKQRLNTAVTKRRKLFCRTVPNQTSESKMTPKQYKEFLKDLEQIAAKANLDENPIIKMRTERR